METEGNATPEGSAHVNFCGDCGTKTEAGDTFCTYAIAAAPVSFMFGLTVGVEVAGFSMDAALRAPFLWLFAILALAAVFGGAGGFFAEHKPVVLARRSAAGALSALTAGGRSTKSERGGP